MVPDQTDQFILLGDHLDVCSRPVPAVRLKKQGRYIARVRHYFPYHFHLHQILRVLLGEHQQNPILCYTGGLVLAHWPQSRKDMEPEKQGLENEKLISNNEC